MQLIAKSRNQGYHPTIRDMRPIENLTSSGNYKMITQATSKPLFDDMQTRMPYNAIICNGNPICSTSLKYKLMQHDEVFDRCIDIMQKAGFQMEARINDFGKTAYLDVVFPNVWFEDPRAGKNNVGYTIRNSYDKTTGLDIFPFALRGICRNGSLFPMSANIPGVEIITVPHIGEGALERLADKMKLMINNTWQIKGIMAHIYSQAYNQTLEFKSEGDLKLLIRGLGMSDSKAKYIESVSIEKPADLIEVNWNNPSVFDVCQMMTWYASHIEQSPMLYQHELEASQRLITMSSQNALGIIEEERKKDISLTVTPTIIQ
jgi:hypothetical protein